MSKKADQAYRDFMGRKPDLRTDFTSDAFEAVTERDFWALGFVSEIIFTRGGHAYRWTPDGLATLLSDEDGRYLTVAGVFALPFTVAQLRDDLTEIARVDHIEYLAHKTGSRLYRYVHPFATRAAAFYPRKQSGDLSVFFINGDFHITDHGIVDIDFD